MGEGAVPDLAGLPDADDDLWSVAEGENEGRMMIVRVNTTAGAWAGHPELPIRLGIAVPLNEPDEAGLPGAEESEALAEVEDLLFDAIGGVGRVVLVVTSGGMREFVAYVRSAEDGEVVVGRVQDGSETHEVQFYAEEDPGWEVYREFLG